MSGIWFETCNVKDALETLVEIRSKCSEDCSSPADDTACTRCVALDDYCYDILTGLNSYIHLSRNGLLKSEPVADTEM